MIPDFPPKIAPSLGTRLKATLDGIDWIIMELGKCVVENQSEGFGISTSTPAAAVDIEDIFGEIGNGPAKQKLSTLSPVVREVQLDNTTLGPQQSSVNPVLPWNLGPLGGGLKDTRNGVQPGQSTLNPLLPWNPGPKASTLNPLDPWNLGTKGPGMPVGPGQSTLGPLFPWKLDSKQSTINPLDPWNIGASGEEDQSTIKPWNLGPFGGGGTQTTLAPKDTTNGLDFLDIFGIVGKDEQSITSTPRSVQVGDIFGSVGSADRDIQVDDIFGMPTTKKTTEGIQIDLDRGSITISSEGVQVEDIFGQFSVDKTTKKASTTIADQILILPSTKSPPLDCESDE